LNTPSSAARLNTTVAPSVPLTTTPCGCAPVLVGSAPFAAAGTPQARTPQAHELSVRVRGSTEGPHHPPPTTRQGTSPNAMRPREPSGV
jgi:hypothetical protein